MGLSLKSLGRSVEKRFDEIKDNPISGAINLAGKATGMGILFQGLDSLFDTGTKIKYSESDEARAKREEAEAKKKSDELFLQALEYSGRIASDPFKDIRKHFNINSDADFESIKDPRIKDFISLISGRQQQQQQAMLQPALSQTRLSLVE